MNSTFKNLIVPAFVASVFLLLCVRPAHADGTVTPLSYTPASYSASHSPSPTQYADSEAAACAKFLALSSYYTSVVSCAIPSFTICVLGASGPCHSQFTGMLGLVNPMSISCPETSTVSGSTCACGAGLMPNSGGTACVDIVTQASADASAAALAAGRSAAAAAAAAAAVLAHSSAPLADLPAIAEAAARNYDFALSQGVSPADADLVAVAAANLFAMNDVVGLDNLQQSMLVNGIVDTSVSAYLGYLAAGTPPLSLAASIGAGALTITGVGMAIAGAAPIATAMTLSTALHLGVLGIVISDASPVQEQAGVSAGALAIQSGATPLQVTLVSQVVAQAVPADATPAQVTAASQAALAAMSAVPEPTWSGPPIGSPTNTASVGASVASSFTASGSSPAAAAAAAAAAVQTVASGGTLAAAQTAATTAAAFVTSGGTAAGAAVVAQQAGAQADTATEGTLKSVLDKLTELLTFGEGVAVNDAQVPGVDRAASAVASVDASVAGLNAAAIAADETDEASLLGAFVFDPQYTACVPFTRTIMGKVATIDLCSYAAMLREVIGWLFALLGAYSIYQTIFKARV